MSDTAQGPDWWQASDGKWYPPQSAQQPPPPAAAPVKKGGCLKPALIIIGILAVLGIGAVAVIGTAAKSVSDDLEKAVDAETEPVDPDRPDAQKEDQSRDIGGSVELSGYTATVTGAGFQPALSEFEKDGYIVADVTIKNRDDKAQPYNTFDWKLQTPNGQVIDPTFGSIDQLGSGDLVPGGNVAGKVVWEIGAAKGDFFIIYKPDAFDAARGIWKVSVT